MSERRATLDAIHRWLVEAGLANTSTPELLDGFSQRLVAAGVPLARVWFSSTGLHPERRASTVVWQDGGIVDQASFAYAQMQTPTWLESPFRYMMDRREPRMRRRLVGEHAVLDFAVLAELREAGFTDWLSLFYGFGWAHEHRADDLLGLVTSWATRRANGFDDGDLAAIEEMAGTLALAAKASTTSETAREVLSTYLGRDPATRVIAGHVRRGAVGRMAAVILYADLRGFTDFTDVAPPEEVTRRLNAYFDCAGAAIATAGGEILKFLGDGILAVFLLPPGSDASVVAAAALDASRMLLAGVAELDAVETVAGHPPLPVDVVLHAGDVTYGNVGTSERLDFTVIGPVVNEAARLEALCKDLDRSLLVSDAFVRTAPALRGTLRSLGVHRLRGVREPREVFALP
jgi:adenylate cyclase